MSLKKITSLFLTLSFFIVLFSTIVLYIAPPGSFASWGGWNFLFMGKGLWRDLHITIGFMFLFFLIIHIFYNFKLIFKYIKKAGSYFLSKEAAAALLIFVLSFIGTAYEVQPFKGMLELGSYSKMYWVKNMERPPYRHAQYSTLIMFSMRTGIDIDKALKKLEDKGFKGVDKETTLIKIASINHTSPNEVYKTITRDE